MKKISIYFLKNIGATRQRFLNRIIGRKFSLNSDFGDDLNINISDDPLQLKELNDSAFCRIINAKEPDEIISELLKNELADISELKFALFYLSSFELSDLKTNQKELNKVLQLFRDKISDIANDNDNFLFYFHSYSKLVRNLPGLQECTKLTQFLDGDNFSVVFDLYSEEQIIALLSSLSIIFQHEIGSFISFFDKKVKKSLIKSTKEFTEDGLLSLLLLFQSLEYFDVDVIKVFKSTILENNYSRSHQIKFICVLNEMMLIDKKMVNELIGKLSKIAKVESEENEDEPEKSLEERKKTGDSPSDKLISIEFRDNLAEIPADVLVDFMYVILEHIPEKLDFIKHVFYAILSRIKTLRMDNFVDLWLIVSKLTKTNPKFVKEPILTELIRVGSSDPNFSFRNLDPNQTVQVIVSLASMKVNDKDLVGLLMEHLIPNVKYLSIENLVILFRSFFVYSNIFEAHFRFLHEEIVSKMRELTPELLKQLKDPIELKGILFKDSPLKALFF